MKLLVAMITLDRSESNRRNYINRTLAIMESSGLWHSSTEFEFHLYDGGSKRMDFINPRWYGYPINIHYCPNYIQPRFNPAYAAYDAGAHTDCDYVIFVEDDVDVCKSWLDGCAAWINKFTSDRYRVITFYTPYREIEWAHHKGERYWNYPVQAYYGSQCLAFRPNDARSCGEFTLGESDGGGGFDMLIKRWHQKEYPDNEFFQATVPCFVQHTGEDSILNPTRFHACSSYPGNDWNPLVAYL